MNIKIHLKKSILITFYLMITFLFNVANAQECVIRVLAVYVHDGANQSTNDFFEEMDDLRFDINFAINGLNNSLNLSGVKDKTIELAAFIYDEQIGRGSDDCVPKNLDTLINRSTQNYRTKRFIEATHPDIIAFITGTENTMYGEQCAVSELDLNTSSTKKKYFAVNWSCMNKFHSLSRQIGLLLGARHDDRLSGPEPIEGYSFAQPIWLQGETDTTTIMGIQDDAPPPSALKLNILNRWSNPDLVINEVNVGDSDHDNAKVIDAQFTEVADNQVTPDISKIHYLEGRKYEEITLFAQQQLRIRKRPREENSEQNEEEEEAPILRFRGYVYSTQRLESCPQNNVVTTSDMAVGQALNNFAKETGEARVNFEKKLRIYPNPFQSTTKINFKVEQRTHIDISILDIKGVIIKNLLSGFKDLGFHEVIWDGTDNSGIPTSSGIYLVRYFDGYSMIQKRLLLKK